MGIGIYTRISEDIEGSGLGVNRQEADCRKLAKKRGWEVAGVYCDNDFSAYKTKIVRPDFERLLSDLELGAIEGVVVWDLDRFARQPKDLERAIDIFDRRNLVFATVQSDIDLSRSDGRTMARVMVAFANKSSMDTARRVRRKHQELRLTGVPVGGNRPFGWKPDRRTLDRAEAKLVRQAAADILAGVGLHTIARRWNEAGVLTTTGKPWRRSVVKQMMLSPRLAGFRVYHKQKALDDQGEPVKGLFVPVLDEETWEAVVAVLTAPERVKRHVYVDGRKYLLSGIVRCADCGSVMFGNANTKWDTFTYSCKGLTAGGGCGKVAITGSRLDEMVTELLFRYLAEREIQREAQPWRDEAALEDTQARIRELMNAYTDQTLSGDVVFPAVSKLEAEVRRLGDERQEWLRSQVNLLAPTNAVEEWPRLEIEQKRAVIGSVIETVAVRRADKPGGRFDPSRVSVVWR